MLQSISELILSLFPDGFDLMAMLKVFAFITAAVVVLGVIGKIAFGKGTLDHAVASAIAILFVYTFFGVLYRVDQALVENVVKQLPLISISGDTVYLFQLEGADYLSMCNQILRVLILTFMVVALDDLIPDSKNTLSWYILQFIIALVATLAYCFLIHCLDSYWPDLLNSFAPMILVSILVFMLFLGALNMVLSLMLTVVNPLIGAVYTFFLGSVLGKIITKSVFSTIVLFALVWFMHSLGYSSFAILGGTIAAFLPFMLLMLVLWYLVGYVL